MYSASDGSCQRPSAASTDSGFPSDEGSFGSLPVGDSRSRLRENRVALRDRLPTAFASHPLASASPERAREIRPRDQQIQIFEEMIFFASHRRAPSGRYRRDTRGTIRCRTRPRRLPMPKRAQQRAGTFAHGGIAQIQDDVARAEISVEIVDGRESQWRTCADRPSDVIIDASGISGCASPTRIIRASGATRISRRNARNDSAIRLYGFKNPKMPISGVLSSRPEARAVAHAIAAGSESRRRAGSFATGPANPSARNSLFDGIAVDDRRARSRENRAQHRNVRSPARVPACARDVAAYASASGTAVDLHFAQVGVPILRGGWSDRRSDDADWPRASPTTPGCCSAIS